MKIAMLTPWATRCGIAEYSRDLTDSFSADTFTILAQYLPPGHLPLYPDSSNVVRCWHNYWLTNTMGVDMDAMLQAVESCDLLHIQFETGIYQAAWLEELITRAKKPVVTTMHAVAVWAGFNPALLGRIITHDATVHFDSKVIRMGIKSEPFVPPLDYRSVCSYGLGRNEDTRVQEAIASGESIAKLTYRTFYAGVGSVWRSPSELRRCIMENWVCVLYYPPVGANVSSSAINLAIACQRPVIVSDTNWFKHACHLPGVYTAANTEQLKELLFGLTDPLAVDSLLWEIESRNQMIKEERRDFASVVADHREVYSTACGFPDYTPVGGPHDAPKLRRDAL